MNSFGKGPTLKDASPWLRDDRERAEQILTVTEINSVAEGLPPLQEETRQRIRERITETAVPAPKPRE
jgi:hypothetical protein